MYIVPPTTLEYHGYHRMPLNRMNKMIHSTFKANHSHSFLNIRSLKTITSLGYDYEVARPFNVDSLGIEVQIRGSILVQLPALHF